jgi:hypothetical protein
MLNTNKDYAATGAGAKSDAESYVAEDSSAKSYAAEDGDFSWFERGEECPICAAHRDPVTGEERFNAETVAAIREGRAMMRGEIPSKLYNSLEEMLIDLDSDD